MSTENFYKQDNSNFVFLWMNSYSVTIQMKAAEQYLHVVLSGAPNEDIVQNH